MHDPPTEIVGLSGDHEASVRGPAFEGLKDFATKLGWDFFVRVDVEDPIILGQRLSVILLLPVALPFVLKNTGSVRLGDLDRAIG